MMRGHSRKKIEQQILQAERTVQRPEREKALGCSKNVLADHQQASYRMRERKVAGNGRENENWIMLDPDGPCQRVQIVIKMH